MFQPPLIDKEAKFGFKGTPGSTLFKSNDEARKAIDPKTVKMDDQATVDQSIKDEVRSHGNGFFGDIGIWGAGAVTPNKWGVKEKILSPLEKMRDKVDEVNTAAGAKIVGNKSQDSLTAKFMSTPNSKKVGTGKNEDGLEQELFANGRKTSLTAPLQNTAKVVTPTLGAFWVGEKLYPPEEQVASNQDSDWEKDGFQEELITERLDKQAALEKVAFLEDEIEKLASEKETLEFEKQAFARKAEEEFFEKRAALEEKVRVEKELLEKTAKFDEFKLRTIAKKRSEHAVKIADEMLERGMIKQAQHDEKIDFLMDCDDKTFNLHSSMVKLAETDEKRLETSPYFIDYRDKDEASSPTRARQGVSKTGQTIGEAARDLRK